MITYCSKEAKHHSRPQGTCWLLVGVSFPCRKGRYGMPSVVFLVPPTAQYTETTPLPTCSQQMIPLLLSLPFHLTAVGTNKNLKHQLQLGCKTNDVEQCCGNTPLHYIREADVKNSHHPQWQNLLALASQSLGL